MFPIRGVSAALKSFGHFTLLVADLMHEATFRYYDSLTDMSPLCLKAAELCMMLCSDERKGLNMPDNCPLRHNEARQLGVDCGLHVMQFIEEEVREYAGEGIAAIPWCDGSHTQWVREKLGQLTKGLNGEVEKWKGVEKKAAAKQAWIAKK